MNINNITYFQNGEFKLGSIRIENGIYKKIQNEPFDDGIDGRNLYLIPGFVDIHTHGISGSDFSNVDTLEIKKMLKDYLKDGVSFILPTTVAMEEDKLFKTLKTFNDYKNDNGETNILGIHLEGPFINKKYKGALLEKYILAPDVLKFKKYLDINPNIKKVTYAIENDDLSLTKLLKEKGISASIGHSCAKKEEVNKGIEFGVNSISHLFNAMTPITSREDSLALTGLLDDRLYTEIIMDFYHVKKEVIELLIKAKPHDKIICITDSIAARGVPDGKYKLGEYDIDVIDGKCHLADGTIAGSTLTFKQILKNLYELNISLIDVVKFTSLNALASLNIEDVDLIIEGFPVSACIIDQNYNLLTVLKNDQLLEVKD